MATGFIGRFYKQRQPDDGDLGETAQSSLMSVAEAAVVPDPETASAAASARLEESLGLDMVAERVNLHRYLRVPRWSTRRW